jgi:hypothetical protein
MKSYTDHIKLNYYEDEQENSIANQLIIQYNIQRVFGSNFVLAYLI